MESYYAIFRPVEGQWSVRFPDAEAIHTCGKDLEEAMEMAVGALNGLMVFGRKGREYQTPRLFEDIQTEAKEGEQVFPIVPSEKIMDEYKSK